MYTSGKYYRPRRRFEFTGIFRIAALLSATAVLGLVLWGRNGVAPSDDFDRTGAKRPVGNAVSASKAKVQSVKTASATTSVLDSGDGSLPQLADPTDYNVKVDFSKIIARSDSYSLGGTMSGYGAPWLASAGQCSNAQCSTMRKLDLGAYRVSIQWNNGNPVSGAGGNGASGPSGDQMVDAIRSVGAEPVLVVGGKGGKNDMDFTPSDAQGLVRHYTSGKYAGSPAVRYFVIGNEPSNSGNGNLSIERYCEIFNASAKAMRQADPDIKLVGPAWPYYDLNVIKQFLQCAGNQVDVVDYHAYGQSSQGIANNIQSSAAIYEQQGKEVRTAINTIMPSRAGQIAQQVGEFNVSPFSSSDTSDERFYTAGNTVWNAIATGSILKGGSRAFIFSDQNNPLGLMFQSGAIASLYGRSQADPQPAFHGIGMFSGEGLFRRFGDQMVAADSSDPDIVAYASADQKNIILINKSASVMRTAAVQLEGAGRMEAAIWQTDKNKPFEYPQQRGRYAVDGGFAYGLPPYSVTTIVLE